MKEYVMLLYAIRHKPTGHYLPPPIGRSGKGGTHGEPQANCIPRLFTRKQNAEIALRFWLKGIYTRNPGSWNDIGDWETDDEVNETITIKPQPHRKADDMEVVPVELHLPIDAPGGDV